MARKSDWSLVRGFMSTHEVNLPASPLKSFYPGPGYKKIFNWSGKHLPTPNQITFVLQTTDNSERNTADKTQFTRETNQNFMMLETLTGRK